MNRSDATSVMPLDHQQVIQRTRPALALLRATPRLIAAAWAARRRKAREAGELYRLSDRELWDVGLSQSDLPSIARGTWRRG